MPGHKCRILSTALLPAAIIQETENEGFKLDTRPFIRTEYIKDQGTQEAVSKAMAKKTVIFTSKNAVEAVADMIQPGNPYWNIYCIDQSTKELVQKQFPGSHVIGSAADAGTLASLIAEEYGETEIIFFCGDQRMDTLPSFLKTKNIQVEEIPVYKTIAGEIKMEDDYDAILFFSPSAVESFFRNNKVSSSTILFAIGNTTGSAIKNFSSNTVITRTKHDKQSLVHEAIHYLKQKTNN